MAARNEGYGEFTLTNPSTGESRTFERKHLTYDAYIEFCKLAYPIITAVGSGLKIGSDKGVMDFDFDPTTLDYQQLLGMCGAELPRMAHLCCKQSDPKITLEDVKRLGYRPQNLLAVVLAQVKHNDMVKEFADFFPTLVEKITALIPETKVALTPLPIEKTSTD